MSLNGETICLFTKGVKLHACNGVDELTMVNGRPPTPSVLFVLVRTSVYNYTVFASLLLTLLGCVGVNFRGGTYYPVQ